MMMVEEINKSVKQNRNWAVLGIGVGLGLLIAYFGYELVMAVDVPAIREAKPKVIVSYISNPRGLRKLTQIEQRQFLDEWRDYLMSDAEAKEALSRHLKELEEEPRKQFVEQIVFQLKEIVVSDAKQYESMATAERSKFVHKRADELGGQREFVEDLGKIFGKDMGGQDEFRKLIFQITTPQERDVSMPYLDAIQRAIEQRRNQRRAEPVAANP